MGGEGGQAILYEYKIANLPELLISSLRIDGVSFMVERVIIVTQIMGHPLCNNREQS